MADFFLPTDEASTLRDYPKKAAVGKQVLSSDYVQLVNRFKATTASAASKL